MPSAAIATGQGALARPIAPGLSSPAMEDTHPNKPRLLVPPTEGYSISRYTRERSQSAEADDSEAIPSADAVLEGLLFVGTRDGKPIGLKQLKKNLPDLSDDELRQRIAALNERYASRGSALEAVAEGRGWRVRLREEYDAVNRRMAGADRENRLSRAALEVAAVVAYRQPITAEQVTELRGRQSSAVLRQLVRLGPLEHHHPHRTKPKPYLLHVAAVPRMARAASNERPASLRRYPPRRCGVVLAQGAVTLYPTRVFAIGPRAALASATHRD